MVPAPSLDVALEETPEAGVRCDPQTDNLDFGSLGFSMFENGCPESLSGPPTEWEYEYQPAVSTASNVYATYVIYYFASGEISAARAAVSDRYSFAVPHPIVRSGTFFISYPSGVTGIKVRSFATAGVDCSAYASPEDCWLAALDGAKYHDEVRYCIVNTAERDFDLFCQADGIDQYAPDIARFGASFHGSVQSGWTADYLEASSYTWRQVWNCHPGAGAVAVEDVTSGSFYQPETRIPHMDLRLVVTNAVGMRDSTQVSIDPPGQPCWTN